MDVKVNDGRIMRMRRHVGSFYGRAILKGIERVGGKF